MILELGSSSEMIRVTAEYSNAVLLAVIPYISDISQKLDLPLPKPVTAEHVIGCGVAPYRDGAVGVRIKGGWSFTFAHGYVNRFEAPDSYFRLQNPDEIPRFFGQLRMNQDEVVQLARSNIVRLGIPLEKVFAELEPRVTSPERVGTNLVPHYRLEWLDPRGVRSVRMDVNAETKRVEGFFFLNRNLERPPPKIAVSPVIVQRSQTRINPAYAWKLVPIVLQAVDGYATKLGLPVPRSLTTNQVARFVLNDNGGWPHVELELTNAWRFIYRNQMVNGYYAPDNLFNSDRRPILIKEFVGPWNLTEAQAITLVRTHFNKLGYDTNTVHIDFKPEVTKPQIVGKEIIPRFLIRWNYARPGAEDLASKVEAEVDADKGGLKSLYYDNMALWNKPPPIDVPISLPPNSSPNPR